MTLNLTPLEDLNLGKTENTERPTTVNTNIDEAVFDELPPIPEDVPIPVGATGPAVRPEQFLGGAEVPPTELEARRTRIEDTIGESVRVRGRNSEIAAAIRDGVICQVGIGFCRFRQRNTAEDFGLDPSISQKLFSGLGVRLLAPKNYLNRLNSLDTQARTLVARFGIKTPWGRFIPRANWARFKHAFDSLRSEFMDTIHTLASKAEDGSLADWVRETYQDFAQETWAKGVRNTWTPDPNWEPGCYSEHDTPPQEYVDAIVTSALSKLPSAGYIRDCARFSYDLSIIQAPDTMLAQDYVGGDQDLQRELLQHLNERKRTLIDDFLRTARETLLENVQGLVEAVTHTLEGKTQVHGKTINKILSKLEDVRYLNVINDQDFEQRILELEEFVTARKAGKNRNSQIDPAAILRQLNRTANQITTSLNRQLEGSEQFSQIGEF